MTFKSRFNSIIAIAYSSVCVCAFILFAFLYHENLERQLSALKSRLIEETHSLDYVLRIRYDAVRAAKLQMEDNLDHNIFDIDQDKISISNGYYNGRVKFHQDSTKENPYAIGNITGIGNVKDFSAQKWEEIKAAYALNPLFKALKHNIESFVSAFYISANNFQILYPWRPSSVSRFSTSFYNRDFFQKSIPQNNPNRGIIWTDSYVGTSQRELMLTCCTPIYHKDEFMGVVGIDFNLSSVDSFVESIRHNQGRILVVNERRGIICDSIGDDLTPTNLKSIDNSLPNNLKANHIFQKPAFNLHSYSSYWVFHAPLRYAPWQIVFHIKYSELMIAVFKEIGPSAFLIIFFATILLYFTNRIILNDFISPAERLVRLIANQGKGEEKDFKDVRNPWLSWFDAVRQVFQDNTILVKKLEKHIHDLDQKVADRTKSITHKNKALQKALENLKQAQNQIVVQEKMAGLGAITAGIAHEIKNPLNFILNFATLSRELIEEFHQMIVKQTNNNESIETINLIKNNLEKIESHAKRADSIVRSMLLHARGVDDGPQLTEINELIEENLILTTYIYKQKGIFIETELSLDHSIDLIMIYRQELGRVLLNIMNNACYSMEQKAKTNPLYTPKLLVSTYDDGKSITIRIKDNGIGISKNLAKNIFNPFFTTKPVGSGTGLGLSLSYDIITNQHHGSIEVESTEGEFAEFIINLPKGHHEASAS